MVICIEYVSKSALHISLVGGSIQHSKLLENKRSTFHNNCRTSASIFPGTLVAKILAISSRVTAISGVAYHVTKTTIISQIRYKEIYINK